VKTKKVVFKENYYYEISKTSKFPISPQLKPPIDFKVPETNYIEVVVIR
jgi:hypothetical protein